MDLAKVLIDDPFYNRARYCFVPLIRVCFRDNSDSIMKRFASLVSKFNRKEIGKKNLISKVHTLLNRQPQLISAFHQFIPQSLPVKRGRKKYVVLDRKLHKDALQQGVDFANLVRFTLQNDDKYMAFVDIMTRFQQHQDVDRVKKEVLPLLRKHPGLEIELSKFLIATVVPRLRKPRRDNVDDVFAFYEDRGDHGTSGEKRTYNEREEKVFGLEDEMYDIDRRFHATESALAATKQLILENSGKDEKEKIMMKKYFSALNVKCLRDWDLEKFLLHETEARYQVNIYSMIIFSCLVVKLKELEEDREKKKESVKKRMRLV